MVLTKYFTIVFGKYKFVGKIIENFVQIFVEIVHMKLNILFLKSKW